MPLSPFANRITSVASALAGGGVGGTYIEASLLLSAVISGMAAACRQFVEAWARFADSPLNPVRISQPLLRQALASSGRSQEASAIAKIRPGFPFPRVVTEEEIDLDETEVQTALPSLQLKKIRQYSYPVIFYEQVRSSVVHESEIGDNVTPRPMANSGRTVSYENYCSTRRVHFHIPWLVEIARSIAASVDRQYSSLSIAAVNSWWVEG